MPHADQENLRFTVNLARQYLHSEKVKAVGDGKDAWIFDIDETTLSNIGYYEQIEFGGAPYNRTKYFAWVMEEKATGYDYRKPVACRLQGLGGHLKLLVKLYRFLVRRANSCFNAELGFHVEARTRSVLKIKKEAVMQRINAGNIKELGLS